MTTRVLAVLLAACAGSFLACVLAVAKGDWR